MQSIISFLHEQLIDYSALDSLSDALESSESSEEFGGSSQSNRIDDRIFEVLSDCLPGLEETYPVIHMAYNGRDPRESIMSYFKVHADIQNYIDGDNECSTDHKFSPSVLSFVENSMCAVLGIFGGIIAALTADDDDIPLD